MDFVIPASDMRAELIAQKVCIASGKNEMYLLPQQSINEKRLLIQILNFINEQMRKIAAKLQKNMRLV